MAQQLSIKHVARAATTAAVKCGFGRLTAIAEHHAPSTCHAAVTKTTTRITQLSHRAPTRLLPMMNSTVGRAGAALVALSSYGGGMLQGDRSDLQFNIEQGATLGVITQGSNRIYRTTSRILPPQASDESSSSLASSLYPSNEDSKTCHATLRGTVAKDGFLVMAPDPCVPFTSSSFVQQQKLELEKDASAILIDWYGAGRLSSGERWEMKRLTSQSSLYHKGETIPFLVESVSLDQRFTSSSRQSKNNDPFGFGGFNASENPNDFECNTFCSVILHGHHTSPVVERLMELQKQLMKPYTRVRNKTWTSFDLEQGDNGQITKNNKHDDFDANGLIDSLSGRVLLGISKVELDGTGRDEDSSTTYVARLAATSNEDIYRVLHSSLKPLQPRFGIEFYRDRIPASTSIAPLRKKHSFQQQKQNEQPGPIVNSGKQCTAEEVVSTSSSGPPSLNGHASWCAYMLADSGLPTGAFAHSAGIEAASQLGLFGSPSSSRPDESKVSTYILAATRSTTQVLTPFVRAGHALVEEHLRGKAGGNTEKFIQQWIALDRYAHAILASNAPACRASMDQGQGLLRVAQGWLKNGSGEKNSHPLLADTAIDDMEALMALKEALVSSSTLGRGHVGPLFGVVAGLLNLSPDEASNVLAFCAARDMVSASVRLNLVGPLAGVSILDEAYGAVNDGLQTASAPDSISFEGDSKIDTFIDTVKNAATCTPVADTIHPCHDLLSIRLFRT